MSAKHDSLSPAGTSDRRVYLDYQATTPVDSRVAAAVVHAMTSAFGNANSSEHSFGLEAGQMVREAQLETARLVGAEAEEVCFTSGATQSARLAFEHWVGTRHDRPVRLVVSPVEHRAVLDAVGSVEQRGLAVVEWATVDRLGRVDLSALAAQLRQPADLVCMMAANNEIGTLYPIPEVAWLAAQAGASLFVDATQAVGRVPIRAREWGVTYLAMSAHKIYGPKGCGALVVQRDWGQDGLTTSGTPNVPGIVGLGEACRLRRLEMEVDEARIAGQRDRLQQQLLEAIPGLVVNGDPSARLAGNLHVAIPDTPADAVLARVGERLAISTGAACSAGAERPSHVLQAIGMSPDLQEGALRIGLGKFTTDQEIELAARLISEAVRSVRAAMVC